MEFKIDPATLVGLGVLVGLIGAQIKTLIEVKKGNDETKKVHDIVNSRSTAMETEITGLKETIIILKKIVEEQGKHQIRTESDRREEL